MNIDSMLITVNAPHSKQLAEAELAACLVDPAAARALPGHMSVFFGELSPAQQLAFAELHNISRQQLLTATKAFARYSGESYPLAL